MALNSVLSWFVKKRIHQIELFKKYPIEVQDELLLRLIKSAQYTEWGNQYGYKDITSVEDYKSRFPVQRYADVLPYVLRMQKGRQNLLWPNEIRWFAKSSGTTSGKSKFIPVSYESLEECHFKGGKDLLSLYFDSNPEAEAHKGKTLVVGGSKYDIKNSDGAYIGDLSAIIMDNLPIWVELKRTPSLDIALLDDWEEKLEKMARFTLSEDVRVLSGVPSWTLVLLKRILEITGKENIREVWPNIELFMHGGVNFAPYRQQFENIISGRMNYAESYNASEGYFGIQDRLHSDELLLMLDYGIYYEFVEMGEWDKKEPKTLSLEEVKKGVQYAIVITTNGGLWRYMLGDTIEFTSLFPFRIRVSGRTSHFINAFGEELIIDNAERAIEKATNQTGAIINEYTAGPVYMSEGNTGAHEWLIEFEKMPHNMDEFIDVLDTELKNLNSDYEAKRTNNFTLQLPIVNALPKGVFHEWLKSKNKLGGQHKVPRLSNSRSFIEELQEILIKS
jgi:hypothetical protein